MQASIVTNSQDIAEVLPFLQWQIHIKHDAYLITSMPCVKYLLRSDMHTANILGETQLSSQKIVQVVCLFANLSSQY
jgi:hypothetical protein